MKKTTDSVPHPLNDLIDLGAISVETKGANQQNYDGGQSQQRDKPGLAID